MREVVSLIFLSKSALAFTSACDKFFLPAYVYTNFSAPTFTFCSTSNFSYKSLILAAILSGVRMFLLLNIDCLRVSPSVLVPFVDAADALMVFTVPASDD